MAYRVHMMTDNKALSWDVSKPTSLRDCIRFLAAAVPVAPNGYHFGIFDALTGKNALHSPATPRVEMLEWPIGTRRVLEVGSFRVGLKRVRSASRQAYEVHSQGRMLGLVFKTDTLEWAYTGAAAGIVPRLGFESSYDACRDLLGRYPTHMLESVF